MEWLGAMFKGIGDTFTAGSNVNLGQINERINRDNNIQQDENLAAMTASERLEFLMQREQESYKTLGISLAALIIAIIIVLLILKS